MKMKVDESSNIVMDPTFDEACELIIRCFLEIVHAGEGIYRVCVKFWNQLAKY